MEHGAQVLLKNGLTDYSQRRVLKRAAKAAEQRCGETNPLWPEPKLMSISSCRIADLCEQRRTAMRAKTFLLAAIRHLLYGPRLIANLGRPLNPGFAPRHYRGLRPLMKR